MKSMLLTKLKHRRSLVLVAVALLGTAGLLAPQAAESARLSEVGGKENGIKPAREPAAGTVTAWEEAGAEFGWIHIDEGGGAPRWEAHDENAEHLPKKGSPFDRADAASGYYGAVRFTTFPMGKLASLPERELCTRLWLDSSGVTDDDLKEVAKLNQLQWLALYRSKVTDAGLRHLTGLTKLRRLGLHDTQVSDEGMKEVARLKQLQYLGLGATQVGDAGLKKLSGLKQLRLLDLAETGVTDEGLKTVAELKEMETLYVSGPAITDAGVDELLRLPKLKYALLSGTGATQEAIDKLQEACRARR
jgi:hypothetical protein